MAVDIDSNPYTHVYSSRAHSPKAAHHGAFIASSCAPSHLSGVTAVLLLLPFLCKLTDLYFALTANSQPVKPTPPVLNVAKIPTDPTVARKDGTDGTDGMDGTDWHG